MISWKTGLIAVAVAALALVLLPVRAAKAAAPAAIPYRGTSAVGALVILNSNGSVRRAFCTGSVLSSPAGNLILTAAHCLSRVPLVAMAFIPGYRHGGHSYPDGLWPVTGQDLPAGRFARHDVNSDFAFLTVDGDVQAETGAETLGTSSPVPASVQVIAYASPGYPVTCTRRPTKITVSGRPQLKFSCGGYGALASGGPFLIHASAKTGNGTVVGVLGGYQKGGSTPSVSYSSPFGATIDALYRAVISAPTAIPFKGASAVGALVILKPNGTINHVRCTGSVLSSPAGNLILTAAHCLGRMPPIGMAFIPEYHYGSRSYPYGLWRVTGQVLPADWLPSRDVNSDFAFLTVHGDVQAETGAETLGNSSPVPASVQVIAYTSPGYPVTCTSPPAKITVSGQQQLKFSCGGYSSGSSGAPFLANVDARTGNGTVIGVLGGYQKGGRTPSVSYSSPFGASVRAFYEAVILGADRA